MYKTQLFNTTHKPSNVEKQEIIEFLYVHLEKYRDPKKYIQKAIEYAIQEVTSFGGLVLLLKENNCTIGIAVINKTGMNGYIPENILVYIAIHKNHRGKGLGRVLMQKIMDYTTGDIALHVEKNNPAKFLYEKIGFTNPYLEMRLKR